MRRTNWKTVSTLVTMIVLTGCTDNMISAPESPAAGPVSIMMAPEGRPSLSLAGLAPNNTSADFTVGPSGGIFFIGSNAVYFPARSICNPAKSSYGPGTWDDACEPSNEKIRIHAEVRVEKTGTTIDFSPSLRFVPSSNPSKWVWLYMYQPTANGAKDLSKFNILYSLGFGRPSIDETIADASLRTYVDTWGGIVSRRVKHFTGYTAMNGRACDTQDAPDADCVRTP